MPLTYLDFLESFALFLNSIWERKREDWEDQILTWESDQEAKEWEKDSRIDSLAQFISDSRIVHADCAKDSHMDCSLRDELMFVLGSRIEEENNGS